MRRVDPTTVLVPFVYFIAGSSSLAGVAATFFFKETLHLSIQQTQILGGMAILPWSIKPLYGILSDCRPVAGLRRKPYLILAGLLSFGGYLALATVVRSFTGALAATIAANLGFALADVIVDGVVAERSRSQRTAGALQSLCRASLMTGALAVAYASGILVERMGARPVFLLTSLLPLLTVLLAFAIREEPFFKSKSSNFRSMVASLRRVANPQIFWAALFLFVWRATPSSGGALNYYLIDELEFTPEFFGRLSAISSAMGIVGVLIFRKWLLTLPLKLLFIGIVVAGMILALPTLGLVYGWYRWLGMSPKLFAMADTLISAPLTEIGFLPLLVLAARVCPKGAEATVFALLASIMNIGLMVSDLGGAALVSLFGVHQATGAAPADYSGLPWVLWIAICSSVIPLPLLRWLPETRAVEELPKDIAPSGMQPLTQPIKEPTGPIA